MSDAERERVVRAAFNALADEFLRRVEASESGNLTIHYQNGIPLKREFGAIKGRILLPQLTSDLDT